MPCRSAQIMDFNNACAARHFKSHAPTQPPNSAVFVEQDAKNQSPNDESGPLLTSWPRSDGFRLTWSTSIEESVRGWSR